MNPTSTELLSFNPSPPVIMHMDINSCFATIEQQANPLLRGRSVAVAAYASNKGVILAASREAKLKGIKTGMRVIEGKACDPQLVVLEPDANKYRYVHKQLRELLSEYTNELFPKSIDEFVMDLSDYGKTSGLSMAEIGEEMKKRITREIGDWITVSIGIGPSRFIAKIASNMQKPDGLTLVDSSNYWDVYDRLTLTDLHGINIRNKARLNKVGIYTVRELYTADLMWLRAAFASIGGYYWYVRIRGWDIDTVEFDRKSFGNQYATKIDGSFTTILPLLQKLTEKTGARMRRKGFKARGIHVSLGFQDGSYWHLGATVPYVLFDSRDIFREQVNLLKKCPELKPVRIISESVFNLVKEDTLQLQLFSDLTKQSRLVSSLDDVNDRWGDFSITPARMLPAYEKVPDRISFGGVSELL